MAVKLYNPVTPSQRGLALASGKGYLWEGEPYKGLTSGINRSYGRNNAGRITSWHRERGHKKLYREIDFARSKSGSATVERIEYDPNRTSYIALLKHVDNSYSYVIATQKMHVGQVVSSGPDSDILDGNALPLYAIPIGTLVHNIELKPGKGGQLVRSAGCYGQIIGKDKGYAIIRLSSGEVRMILLECVATIGVVSNSDHRNATIGKAGRSRWLGRRPHVRGVAMNPVDHPHGGGEGKTSGGRHPVTPWGKSTKGKKTASRKKRSLKYIVRAS